MYPRMQFSRQVAGNEQTNKTNKQLCLPSHCCCCCWEQRHFLWLLNQQLPWWPPNEGRKYPSDSEKQGTATSTNTQQCVCKGEVDAGLDLEDLEVLNTWVWSEEAIVTHWQHWVTAATADKYFEMCQLMLKTVWTCCQIRRVTEQLKQNKCFFFSTRIFLITSFLETFLSSQ